MNTVKIRDIEIGAGAPKISFRSLVLQKKISLKKQKAFDSIPGLMLLSGV